LQVSGLRHAFLFDLPALSADMEQLGSRADRLLSALFGSAGAKTPGQAFISTFLLKLVIVYPDRLRTDTDTDTDIGTYTEN
jgi:hypothetical protein